MAQSALSDVLDPLTGKDWVSTRQLKSLTVSQGVAHVDIALGYPAQSQWPAYTALVQAENHLKKRGIVQTGDVYAITCGEPMGSPGGTNMLKICRVE